jgi:hypothetical protein
VRNIYRLTFLLVIAAVLFSLWAPRSLGAAEEVTCSTTAQRTTCRISEPTVTRRISTYPQITFKAGDQVTVAAGGCVQTGGHGRTWKSYVNPSGPNSDRLYHGLIQIPGVESDLVRIAGVVNQPVVVPANAVLRLGYEDDGYSDNGYWGHDDGTENQCRGVGNAFVVLTIDAAAVVSPAPVVSAAPFDLVFTATDPNAFPLNPQWAWQRDHSGAVPDADTQCFTLPGNFSNSQCTTQSPSIDEPEGWNGFWCARGAQHSIHGHVNWMPATWQGPITWDSHSSPGADDDYNVNLVPPAGAGLTASSEGRVHSEFDSDETIDHFRTPWWNSFHAAVDKGDASARAMIDGKPAIMIGLAGLDCEHGCAIEMHPVYAMAIHLNDNPSDDTWAIFVRNSGNEGYCSQDQHYLDTNQMAFFIPRPSAKTVQVKTASTFLTNSNEASGPSVSLVSGSGAIVEFGLPDPEKGARINGELHLQWTVAPGASAPVTGTLLHSSPAVFRSNAAVETEQRLEDLVRQLPPDKRQSMRARLARSQIFDEVAPAKRAPTAPRLTLPRPASVRAVRDAAGARRNVERAHAICTAYDGKVPGLPTACAPNGKPTPPTPIPIVPPHETEF